MIILIVILLIAIVIGAVILSRIKSAKANKAIKLPNGKFHLYKDFIIVVDETGSKPIFKFGWVLKVDGNNVEIKYADGKTVTAVWTPDKNNFYVK